MSKIDKRDVLFAIFDEGTACDDCPHAYSIPDRWDEPGGRECHVINQPYPRFGTPLKPEDCPGFEKMLEKFKAQEAEDKQADEDAQAVAADLKFDEMREDRIFGRGR